MTQEELRRVRQRAAKAAYWRQKLEESIREASSSGASLRSIAEQAGWSHEQVRRTLQSSDHTSGSTPDADLPK